MYYQRWSYYWDIRGSVVLIIGESVIVNLDHLCLDSQSYNSLYSHCILVRDV